MTQTAQRRARVENEIAKVRDEREALERQREQWRQRVTVGGALLALGLVLGAGVLSGAELPGPDAKSASLLVVLLIGLTAGGLSCLAVQGGLLTVAVAGDRVGDDRAAAESRPKGDAAPILWFLGAKLTAYTLLGALLGAAGSLAQPSVTLRAILQGATALLMIATALHFLGVHPVFRYVILQPPRFLARRLRRTARAGGAFAPATLGAMTILLPCGVTQAMQLLAINSGSAAVGAATLFVFVLGTSPLFFVLGFFATKLSEALHARFLKIAAIAILVVALLALDGALKLGGAPLTSTDVRAALVPPKAPPARAQPSPDGVQEARITASAGGYSPERVRIAAGKPARLVFSGDGSGGCTVLVILNDRQYQIPTDGDLPIELPPQQRGSIEYSCAMGMYGGRIDVV